MESKRKKIFRSRVSVLLLILFSLVPLVGLFLDERVLADRLIIVAFIYLCIAVLFFVWDFKIKYTISENKLSISSFGEIAISDIISIRRSYSTLNSPAGSLKKLDIKFETNGSPNSVQISPVREEKFIEILKILNPNIIVDVPIRRGIWRFWDWDI